MAEDLVKNLATYELQLKQAKAALGSDPTNEEVLRLQKDLEEVIALTKDLLETQNETAKEEIPVEESQEPVRKWKVGDTCSAMWSKDNKWYNCIIDAITDDGMVAVTFEGYNQTDVSKLNLLREKIETSGDRASVSALDRKRKYEQNKLTLKKKKQKKIEKQKEVEAAHESDKAKWQAFSSKMTKSKKFKGVTKKSIFATPEAANGRVGIGTCGIGGKPMTEFSHAEKWRKGT